MIFTLTNVGRFLLPDSLPALFAGALLLFARDDRFAERGPCEPTAVDRKEPALLARARPLALHGFAPGRKPAPLVLIAANGDTPATRYDALTRHLASHGFAALVLEREPGEVWSRYADALELAVRQLASEAADREQPWHKIVDMKAVALVADRDAEAAAARVAATVPNVAALAVIDGDDPGCALPWLDQVHAPFLYVSARDVPGGALLGTRSFNASGAADGRRWLVRILAPGPLLGSADAVPPPEVVDLHALVARFVTAELVPDPEGSATMTGVATLGQVRRECRSGRDALARARR